MEVILTQITAPVVSRRFVQRPRLARIVQQRPGAKLVFIGAPPGYGKTAFASALVSTANHRGSKCAWVSLGQQDDDPDRFWQLVAASLESSDKTFKLRAPHGPGSAYDMIAAIVNQAARRPRTRYCLAIDNYHFISSDALNEQVGSLVANVPANTTVLLASDCAPTFPVSALRLEEAIVEIYVDDLRFRLDESEYYLNEICQLGLESKEVKNVHHATRGWPAGLQMASISYARGHTGADALAAIEEMRSAFFIDEVVSRKSGKMQSFLLRVSHLPRLSPLLAEYVTGMAQAGALLSELEHDELFDEVLHESPPWYAFSKTFRETLHQHALQTMPPAAVKELHKRASEWFEKNGEPALAVEFALKAHEPGCAARIIANNTAAVLAQSQGPSLITHLEQVNLEGRMDSARIGAVTAWAHCSAGKPRQALHWISLARAASEGKAAETILLLDAIEARAGSLSGNFDAAAERAERTLAAIDAQGRAASEPWLYLTVRHTLGESYPHLGEFEKAVGHLSYCADMALPSGRPVIHYLAACELSELQALRGQWDEAQQLARTALRAQRQRLAEAPWSLALVQMQLADLLLQSGQLDEAEDMAMRARRRLANQSNSDGRLCLLLLDAQLAIARGNRPAATKSLNDALRFAQTHAIPRGKRPLVCARALTHLMLIGERPLATASMEEALGRCDARDPHTAAVVGIAYAASSLFGGTPEDAASKISQVLSICEGHGFFLLSAEALILKALSQFALKDIRASVLSLLDAASALEPHGLSFPLIAAGNRIGALIEQALAYCAGANNAFRQEKATAITFLRHCANLVPASAPTVCASPDRGLTPRERQVYHLLQSGKSRREIAGQLGISYNTVRVHVSNIYKKTQAGSKRMPAERPPSERKHPMRHAPTLEGNGDSAYGRLAGTATDRREEMIS